MITFVFSFSNTDHYYLFYLINIYNIYIVKINKPINKNIIINEIIVISINSINIICLIYHFL